ncbi:MAG: hypothetical protein E4H40_05100 [Candidatus Brocadiia bacterium]|nr:MAG: hypothetical protein E4H40_05100 [Candidatus Brocadiia bacterium]
MAKRSRKKGKTQTQTNEMAAVAFTEDLEQARDYEVLLKNNDIPAVVIEDHDKQEDLNGYSIMVPEEYVDEAHVVIESQDAYDDLYDFADEDKEDYEDEDFDETY